MDFTLPPDLDALRLKTRAFVAEHILPVEQDRTNWDAHDNIRLDALDRLILSSHLGFGQSKSIMIYLII